MAIYQLHILTSVRNSMGQSWMASNVLLGEEIIVEVLKAHFYVMYLHISYKVFRDCF